MKNLTKKMDKKFNFMNRFLTGLVIALAASLTAFEWTTVTSEPTIVTPRSGTEIPDIMPPIRFVLEEVEKPKPQSKSDQVKIVVDIVDKVKEIQPDPVEPTPKIATVSPTTNIGNYGEEEEIDENLGKIYNAVQIFAHYEECASLEGTALMDCSQESIMNLVRDNFDISRQLKDAGGRQTAILTFVINEEGNVTDINILRETSKAMGRDAVKAIKKLPKMIPAVQQGRNVKLRMNIPISVQL